jgi:hypothetical protein
VRIGVSLISYFPWGIYFPAFISRLAREAGFDFLQAMPLRGVNSKFYPVLPVSYIEDVWNSGSFNDVIKGLWRKDLNAPKILDWLLFSGKTKSQKIFQQLRQIAGVKTVVHQVNDLKENCLLEVHPGLWLTPAEIIAKVGGKRILTLDLYHLRRKPRSGELIKRPLGIYSEESVLGPWQESLRLLLPYTALIHLSPSREYNELNWFLGGKETEFEKMLIALRDLGFRGDGVVETTLGLKGVDILILQDTLRVLVRRIKDIVAR